MFRPGHAPLRSTVPGLFVHDHGHAGPGGTGAWSLRGEVGSGAGKPKSESGWMVSNHGKLDLWCVYIYIIYILQAPHGGSKSQNDNNADTINVIGI